MILFKYLILYVSVLFLLTSCTEKNFTLHANDNKTISDLNSSSNHIIELNKKITSTQLDIKADLSRIDSSINNYILQLENLFNKYNKGSSFDDKKLSILLNELAKNREDFRDFQKQLFLVLTQLSRDNITQSENFTAIIASSRQNCKSSNTIIGCNSDIKILKEYLEILLKKEQNISTTKDDAIDYFTKSITDSKDRFEYFVYFVGIILIFIGSMIFVTVRALGIWQHDKINTYDKEIKELTKNIKDELKTELNNYKTKISNLENNYIKDIETYEKRHEQIKAQIVNYQDLMGDLDSKINSLDERDNLLEKRIIDKMKEECCPDDSSPEPSDNEPKPSDNEPKSDKDPFKKRNKSE